MEKKMISVNEVEGYEIEGYDVCDTDTTSCLLDCFWPLPPHAFSYDN